MRACRWRNWQKFSPGKIVWLYMITLIYIATLDGSLDEDVNVEENTDTLCGIAEPGPSSLSGEYVYFVHASIHQVVLSEIERPMPSKRDYIVIGNSITDQFSIHSVIIICIIGTLIDHHPDLLQDVTDEPSENQSSCSKDLGVKKRLRHWSRGHVIWKMKWINHLVYNNYHTMTCITILAYYASIWYTFVIFIHISLKGSGREAKMRYEPQASCSHRVHTVAN